MDTNKDYYSILEVDVKANAEILRASYRRLAKLYHPDKNPGDLHAEEHFKAINEAYEILRNVISRNIYDGFRADVKKEEPVRKTTTRKFSVTREKRIYVQGVIEVKFQGDPELADAYARQWEQRFTVFPTEVLVTILSTDIYNNEPPREFQMGYSTADLFATPLEQPINCKIITGDKEVYFQLSVCDIRIKDLSLCDITRYEEYSFGTLSGSLFGYVPHRYEEDVTEEYTEFSGATGQVETKMEGGTSFTRQEFYASDRSTYWAEWKRRPTYAGKDHGRSGGVKPIFRKAHKRQADWSWLFILLILVGAGRCMSHVSRISAPAAASRRFDSVSPTRTTVVRVRKDQQADTLISHMIRWEDYDSACYEIQVSVPLSALKRSTAAHEQMDVQQYAMDGIGSVYRFMLDIDKDAIKPVAAGFDSLARIRRLSRDEEASMVVSCIQSIPYSLIVDRSCSDNYADDYISQYLSRCKGDCCKGYSKFGVQTPVEFIGDLKGDCDTRALLLYELLGRLGYKVALMTSPYYKHALIAVDLGIVLADPAVAIHINGRPYYLWETTSKGFGPGKLPDALSNLSHWNISLSQ